jgi:nitroreductase
MNDTIDLLKRRRSLAPQFLEGPAPDAATIETLLAIAARVPDHGKLAPWRFVLFEGDARARAGAVIEGLARADDPEMNADRLRVERERLTRAPLVVGVVSRAAPHFKIPEWEQVMSAGAVCMNLIVAATALGFGACWLTEWYAYDRRFCAAVGLAGDEKFAGLIHIGHATIKPEDRVRPALADIVSRF